MPRILSFQHMLNIKINIKIIGVILRYFFHTKCPSCGVSSIYNTSPLKLDTVQVLNATYGWWLPYWTGQI